MINHPECFARFSYAPLRAQIVQTSQGGSIAVPHGVSASGVLNLLGHKIEAEIEISPTRFHVEGKMDPLTLGSVLTITRSETDAERVVTIVALLLSGFVFAYVVSEVTSLLLQIDRQSQVVEEK